MKIKEFEIMLDIKKTLNQETFEVVQGDSKSNIIRISLMDGLEPYDLTGTTVEIVFIKADGKTVQQTEQTGLAIINEADGRFQCVLKTNTIACPGPVKAEVRIIDDEVLMTTTRFGFYVKKSLINDETVESSDEFPLLTQLIVEANSLISRAEQIEERVPSAVMDNLNTLSTSLNGLLNSITGQIINDPTKINNAAVNYDIDRRVNELTNNLANLLFNKRLSNMSETYPDANDLPFGIFHLRTSENLPSASCVVFHINLGETNTSVQIAISALGVEWPHVYKRHRSTAGVWGNWYKFTGIL